jgi:thiol-disulfide isomerase/thioredoxin
MRKIIPFIVLFLAKLTFGQSVDSSRLNLISDAKVGQLVTDILLKDTSGNTVKLSSFKGKTLYIDFWSTTCVPCIKVFPYEDSLLTRLNKIGIDSNILLIKICGDSPLEDWKSIIRTNNSRAINLYLPGKDYKLFRRYCLHYYGTYHLVDSNFRYLGTNIFRPNDNNIDYYLFRATKHITFIKAVRELQQFEAEDSPPEWYIEWKTRRNKITN